MKPQISKTFLFVFYLSIVSFNYVVGQGIAKKSDFYRTKAEELFIEGKSVEAMIYYQKAFDLVKASDKIRAANLCVDISTFHHQNGDFIKAAKICNKGLKFIEQSNKPDTVVFKIHSSLSEIYRNLNYSDSVSISIQRANLLLQQNPSIISKIPIYVVYFYNNQGISLYDKGNYQQGISYIEKSIELANKHNLKDEIPLLESHLAELYEHLHDYKKARPLREKTKINYQRKDLYRCQILLGLGWNFLLLEQYQAAINEFYQAQQLYNTLRLSNNSFSAKLELFLGIGFTKIGNYTKADQYLTQSIETYTKKIGFKGSILNRAFRAKASLEALKGNNKAALKNYQAAIFSVHTSNEDEALLTNPKSKGTIIGHLMVISLIEKARLLNQMSSSKPAFKQKSFETYLSAIEQAATTRSEYDTEQQKLMFEDAYKTLYDETIEIGFEIYKQNKNQDLLYTLFGIIEQNKAASLTDILHENSLKPVYINRILLQEERQIKDKIANLNVQLFNSVDFSEIAKIKSELNKNKIELHRLWEKYKQLYPIYYDLKFRQKNISLAEIQEKLNTKAAFISYYKLNNNLYIFVVKKNTFDCAIRTINNSLFTNQLETLKTQIYSNPGFGKYKGTTASIYCYQQMIDPISSFIKTNSELIISRDWSFNFLPFEVLETGNVIHDYLFKKYATSYAYSAKALLGNKNQSKSIKVSPLLIAPFAGTTLETSKKASSRDTSLGTLPYSQQEIASVKGKKMFNNDATKAHFMKEYTKANILHFATHAKTDDQNPMASFIAFYPAEDNKLYTESIYNLNLSENKLVILSACETGNGLNQQNEGVISLARAFSYAGCPSVVSTLWNAHDRTTAFLSSKFHYYLQQGYAVDESLQKARLDFFASDLYSKYNHPFFWANFVLYGENQAIYYAGFSQEKTLYLIIGLVSCMGIVLFLKRHTLIQIFLPKQFATKFSDDSL